MPAGFGSGSHSLTIFTAAGLKSDVGIWLFGNGSPVNGLRSARGIAEKSPLRMAADGTRPERGRRACAAAFVPWYDPKKNVRFLTIGPPNVPPYCDRFRPSSTPGVKKLFALNL